MNLSLIAQGLRMIADGLDNQATKATITNVTDYSVPAPAAPEVVIPSVVVPATTPPAAPAPLPAAPVVAPVTVPVADASDQDMMNAFSQLVVKDRPAAVAFVARFGEGLKWRGLTIEQQRLIHPEVLALLK